MNKVRQLSVGKQVTFIFGSICAILVVIGVFLFSSLRAIERHNQELKAQILQEWTLSIDLARNLRLEQDEVFQHVQAKDNGEMKRLDRAISGIRDAESIRWAEYGKLVDNETETGLYARALQAREKYWEQTSALLALSRANRDAEAKDALQSRLVPAYEEYQKTISDIADWTAKEAGEMATTSTRLVIRTRTVGDTLVGLAMLITIGTGLALVRVARRLKEDNVLLQTEIAERKLAEEQIERLRNEHKTILNSISEGVHWIDVDGRVKFENPAAVKIFGYETGELIGKPGHLTLHHSHADGAPYPEAECPICITMKNGVVRHVKDEVFWRKGGASFPVEYTSTPVRDENGRLAGVVVVFTDVTDLKRIEARMFQSQKMETVGKLAGGVAHEFNSILTAIIGQSELLLGDLSPEDPLGKSVREIRQAADRAATLTRQLLAYGQTNSPARNP